VNEGYLDALRTRVQFPAPPLQNGLKQATSETTFKVLLKNLKAFLKI